MSRRERCSECKTRPAELSGLCLYCYADLHGFDREERFGERRFDKLGFAHPELEPGVWLGDDDELG